MLGSLVLVTVAFITGAEFVYFLMKDVCNHLVARVDEQEATIGDLKDEVERVNDQVRDRDDDIMNLEIEIAELHKIKKSYMDIREMIEEYNVAHVNTEVS